MTTKLMMSVGTARRAVRNLALLAAAAVVLGAWAERETYGAETSAVSGTFVQRKVLKDIDVTLTSTGTWRFEKDRAFEWRTLKPMPSLFVATPTNYTFSVGGRTTTRSLKMKIEDVAQIFEIKEMKEFVVGVETSSEKPVFSMEGLAIPSALRVIFKNGDRLEIELKR